MTKKARVDFRVKDGLALIADNSKQARKWAKKHNYHYVRRMLAKRKNKRAKYYIKY